MKPLSLVFATIILFVMSCTPTKEAQGEREAEKRSLVAHVELNDPLDQEMIQAGTEIFLSKCAKCHAMDTVEFGVPAFAGVVDDIWNVVLQAQNSNSTILGQFNHALHF